MANFTLRLPDDRYQRLKQMAEMRNISVNKLFEEMATLMLAEQDVRTRLELRKKRGSREGLLAALAGLDKLEGKKKK
jgi:predicted DNA-binding ribbon-helix-helix protein